MMDSIEATPAVLLSLVAMIVLMGAGALVGEVFGYWKSDGDK